MELTLEIKGAAELADALRRGPLVAGPIIEKALDKVAVYLLRKSIEGAPIDTGKLRQSIHIESEPGSRLVLPAVDYAIYVETGSPAVDGKLMAIDIAKLSPRGRAAFGLGKKNTSGMIFFTKRKAIPARPFMGPAIDATQGYADGVFEDALEQILEKL